MSRLINGRYRLAEPPDQDPLTVTGDEATVARLRRQNHEHAALRDRQAAALQSRVDRHENAIRQARERVRGTPVDWTNDPPSRKPDGWWSYQSTSTREVLIAAVRDHAGRRGWWLRIAAAFLLGLAVGLSAAIVRAAPRPATQVPQSGASATGTVVEYRTPAPRASVVPAGSGGGLLTRHTPGATITGLASFYRDPRQPPGALYAALPGPWRSGRLVAVCGFQGGVSRCRTAPVITTCGCGGPPRKVIDLSPALMEAVAGWTAAERWRYGVLRVSVEVLRP